MERSLSVTFARGARRVTGSNFLIEYKDISTGLGAGGGKTTKILIDCGLAQGERFCESVNSEKFSYDPSTVDAIFFTHAHADHIGLFPKLVKEGFAGKAYATAPTVALIPIMLEDSLKIVGEEAKRCGDETPYTASDVVNAVEMLEVVPYHSPIKVAEGVTVTLYNAGHILGSASVLIDVFGTTMLFTGDLGRVPAVLVPEREIPKGVQYLFTESVYGNRVHTSIETSREELLEVVREVANKKGTLLIPAFSLERTQIILAALDKGITNSAIPSVPVFLDSPLAAKVTEVYRKYPEFLNDEIKARVTSGDDPFDFESLTVTARQDESDDIAHTPVPKIIIAGAGMSHGGRIRRHETKNLPDKNTMLLLAGYQVPGSLGRRLKDGAKEVTIDGVKVTVRAKVQSIDGFSAHADRNDLMSYVEGVNPQRVFVILGDTEASTFLAQRISGFLDIPVDVPREGETVEIPLQ